MGKEKKDKKRVAKRKRIYFDLPVQFTVSKAMKDDMEKRTLKLGKSQSEYLRSLISDDLNKETISQS